ncbi:MAG: ABC transporter transmembrane domain-containing protein, partial [Thermoguttaceae bacterium]
MNSTHDIWENVAPELRSVVEARLLPGETPLVWMEFDLDEQLHYTRGLVVLSDRRLLSVGPLTEAAKTGDNQENSFRFWPIDSSFTLRTKEHFGTGILELLGPEKILYHWRFTAGKVKTAHQICMRFERLQEGDANEEEDSSESLGAVCPSCGALLAPEQTTCPECEAAKAKPPMQALSRLIGFAKPRAPIIIFGFALMLCSTAADLIPTYLKMPLINKVLIPRQFEYAWYYIVGFAGAWILTWLLTWARTYVLAYASEAIAADLRNRTYAHLQSLSIDYFGGKRTGDLIARVSTDTDRICYFLSVYVLDFANDLLMLVMTAVLLLSINYKLAIVSLVPLPLIAYLVHKVRTRLRRGFQLGTRTWGEMTSVLADTIP